MHQDSTRGQHMGFGLVTYLWGAKWDLPTLLANLLLASYQKRLGLQLGVKPGAELLEAVKTAEEKEIPVSLCDRSIRATMLRAWRTMSFWKNAALQRSRSESPPKSAGHTEKGPLIELSTICWVHPPPEPSFSNHATVPAFSAVAATSTSPSKSMSTGQTLTAPSKEVTMECFVHPPPVPSFSHHATSCP